LQPSIWLCTAGRALAAVLVAAACVCSAQAQYPNRPVRFVVPYPPGGGTDFTAREIGQRLSESLGQAVVIDNRPGAGATLGHGIVAKAAPDGYTILLATTGGMVSGPALGVKVAYQPLKDFAHIGFLTHVPYTLVTSGTLPAASVRELIDLAKASPGKLNFGSPGAGTPNHLGGVMLMLLTGIEVVHVPYKGGAPLMTALVAGQMQLAFSSPPQALPHVRAGRMKMLGVGHPTRLKSLPDVPAINETVPGFINTGWWGVAAPAATPRAIVERLNAAVNQALMLPEVEKKFALNGVIAAPSTPEEFQRFVAEDHQRWTKVIKDANLRLE
jgi:tripartite-type tricarboxylate transporter receptor subunit TctC